MTFPTAKEGLNCQKVKLILRLAEQSEPTLNRVTLQTRFRRNYRVRVWVSKEKGFSLKSENSKEQNLRHIHKNILLKNIEGLRQKQEDQYSEENTLPSIAMQQLKDTEN